METFIELTEDDLSQIAGGSGIAKLSFAQLAVGVTFGHVTAIAAQSVTATAAAQAALLTVSAG